jgi:hypothetical protein
MASKNVGTGAAYSTVIIRLNGDTSTNYTLHRLNGTGSSANVSGYATGSIDGFYLGVGTVDNGYPNIQGVSIVDFSDYNSTTKNKTARWVTASDVNTSGYIQLGSGLWVNTASITSITCYINDNFLSTSIALYGIKG